ncbi:MAG: hypothetical protein EXQ49_06265 [Acidobacteria bacterium]|nr:hypothetical protein [Acidobacteriota bacterium]
MQDVQGLVCALVLAIGVQAGQPSVRPQDDLHQFANAAWMAGAPLSRERMTVNASTALIDQVELDLRAIIEGLATDESANGRPEVRQALSLYASMMNQAEVERRGLDPLKADLARIDGIQTPRDLAVVAGYLSSIAAGGGAVRGAGLSGCVEPLGASGAAGPGWDASSRPLVLPQRRTGARRDSPTVPGLPRDDLSGSGARQARAGCGGCAGAGNTAGGRADSSCGRFRSPEPGRYISLHAPGARVPRL